MKPSELASPIFLVGITLIVAIAAGIYWSGIQSNEREREETEEKEIIYPGNTETNIFDFRTLKQGQFVGPVMIADEVEPINENTNEGRATFVGIAQVGGTYKYYDDQEPFLAGQICLSELLDLSEKDLPRTETDDRDTWFCLEIDESKKSLFGQPGDTGTVVLTIASYTYVLQPSESWNTAKFVNIGKIFPANP